MIQSFRRGAKIQNRMTLDGPYIQEHQLPSDLPLWRLGKLLLWRLGIIAAAGSIVTLILGLILIVLMWPASLGIVAAVIGAYIVYEMQKREKAQDIRVVASLRDLEKEFASVVSGASRYIISVGSVARSPGLSRDIRNKLAESADLRYYDLVPDARSTKVHEHLGSLMICANEEKVVFTLKGVRITGQMPLAFVVRDRLLVDSVYRHVLPHFARSLDVLSSEARRFHGHEPLAIVDSNLVVDEVFHVLEDFVSLKGR